MMTEIHAQVMFYLEKNYEAFLLINYTNVTMVGFSQGGGKGSKTGLESCASLESGGPLPKKHTGDKKLTAEKKKMLKDRKRTLKRL